MAYSTEADIKKQLPEEQLIELSDDDGDGVADSGVVERAITDADAEIDSYLSVRYTVPLSPVPARAQQLSVDIAIWNLYSRRTVLDEIREKRYNAAIAFLKDVASGKANIDDPASGEQQIKTSRSKEDRIFTIGRPSTGESGTLDNF